MNPKIKQRRKLNNEIAKVIEALAVIHEFSMNYNIKKENIHKLQEINNTELEDLEHTIELGLQNHSRAEKIELLEMYSEIRKQRRIIKDYINFLHVFNQCNIMPKINAHWNKIETEFIKERFYQLKSNVLADNVQHKRVSGKQLKLNMQIEKEN